MMLETKEEKPKTIKFEDKQPDSKKLEQNIKENKIKEKINTIKIELEKLRENKKFNEKFEFSKILGQGASGFCVEGNTKDEINKKLCLKFIYLDSNKTKREAKFKKNKEKNILSKLKNKNVINYIDCGLYNDYLCIFTEIAKYGDLSFFARKILRRRFLSESLLCYISCEILSALKYCHDLKIVHLDIKPQNILVTDDIRIKLSDFSISSDYSSFKSNTKVVMPYVGTSFFMAPELIGQKSIYAGQINKLDIYSFGVLLYYFAYGYFPYCLSNKNKNDYVNTYDKIMANELKFEDLKYYSNKFTDFLKNLLNKDINERYSIDQALKDDWILKGKIFYEEKVKLSSNEKFLINLLTNNFKKFNSSLKK